MADLSLLAEEVRAALNDGVEPEDLLALVEFYIARHVEDEGSEDA